MKDADIIYACVLVRSRLAGEKAAEEQKIDVGRYQVTPESWRAPNPRSGTKRKTPSTQKRPC